MVDWPLLRVLWLWLVHLMGALNRARCPFSPRRLQTSEAAVALQQQHVRTRAARAQGGGEASGGKPAVVVGGPWGSCLVRGQKGHQSEPTQKEALKTGGFLIGLTGSRKPFRLGWMEIALIKGSKKGGSRGGKERQRIEWMETEKEEETGRAEAGRNQAMKNEAMKQ